jgi:hypothetical protein
MNNEDSCNRFLSHNVQISEALIWILLSTALLIILKLPYNVKIAISACKRDFKKQNAENQNQTISTIDIVLITLSLIVYLIVSTSYLQSNTLFELFQAKHLCLLLVIWSLVKPRKISSVCATLVLIPYLFKVLALELISINEYPSNEDPISLYIRLLEYSLLLLVPFHLLSRSNQLAVRLIRAIPAVRLIGCWCVMQINWTVLEMIGVVALTNIDHMLCPSTALFSAVTTVLPVQSAGRILVESTRHSYRTALTVLVAMGGYLAYDGYVVLLYGANRLLRGGGVGRRRRKDAANKS